VITLQIADPSSRQRGRPIDTRPQISDSNTPTGNNIWSQVPQGYSIPRHSDRLTISHKVISPHLTINSVISLKRSNRWGSVAEMQCVSCEVRIAFTEGGNTTTGYGAVNISRTLQLSLPIAE
jgi:hypothetical protein